MNIPGQFHENCWSHSWDDEVTISDRTNETADVRDNGKRQRQPKTQCNLGGEDIKHWWRFILPVIRFAYQSSHRHWFHGHFPCQLYSQPVCLRHCRSIYQLQLQHDRIVPSAGEVIYTRSISVGRLTSSAERRANRKRICHEADISLHHVSTSRAGTSQRPWTIRHHAPPTAVQWRHTLSPGMRAQPQQSPHNGAKIFPLNNHTTKLFDPNFWVVFPTPLVATCVIVCY